MLRTKTLLRALSFSIALVAALFLNACASSNNANTTGNTNNANNANANASPGEHGRGHEGERRGEGGQRNGNN